MNLAQVYSLQGKDEAALPLFRRVLERDGSNATARMALARAETEKGNYKGSLELAKPVLAAFKLSPDGVLVLAIDFLKTGDRPSAAALVGDSKRLGTVSAVWSASFAEILVKGGLVAEGTSVLEQARTAALRRPRGPEARPQRARDLGCLGSQARDRHELDAKRNDRIEPITDCAGD